MIVREVFSEIGKDGKRVTGERFVEMPGVMTEAEGLAETERQARGAELKRLQDTAAADLIDAIDGNPDAVVRVRATALKIRQLREAGVPDTKPRRV
jgi:hypothetical protein